MAAAAAAAAASRSSSMLGRLGVGSGAHVSVGSSSSHGSSILSSTSFQMQSRSITSSSSQISIEGSNQEARDKAIVYGKISNAFGMGKRNAYLKSLNDPNQLPITRREIRRARRIKKKESALQKKRTQREILTQGFEEKSKASPTVRIKDGIKSFKPITPGIRHVRQVYNPHLHKGPPERILTEPKRKSGGRNSTGRITVRGVGGGHKQRIRLIDFYRNETGKQNVVRIEYDPGRSAHIALLEHDVTKIRSYILAPDGIRQGDSVKSFRVDQDAKRVFSGASFEVGSFRLEAIRPGNCLPLRMIPPGTAIHNIGLRPNGPAKLARSAGTFGSIKGFEKKTASEMAKLTSKGKAGAASAGVFDPLALPGSSVAKSDDDVARDSFNLGGGDSLQAATAKYAQVAMQSGEIRLIHADSCATVGKVSNINHRFRKLGKAGRARWLGMRPKTRGVAMNASEHPHGGGEGKSKGNKQPRSVYGKLVRVRTRKPGTRRGNKMVIKERTRQLGARKRKS